MLTALIVDELADSIDDTESSFRRQRLAQFNVAEFLFLIFLTLDRFPFRFALA
jgi:hypothetical protein